MDDDDGLLGLTKPILAPHITEFSQGDEWAFWFGTTAYVFSGAATNGALRWVMDRIADDMSVDHMLDGLDEDEVRLLELNDVRTIRTALEAHCCAHGSTDDAVDRIARSPAPWPGPGVSTIRRRCHRTPRASCPQMSIVRTGLSGLSPRARTS